MVEEAGKDDQSVYEFPHRPRDTGDDRGLHSGGDNLAGAMPREPANQAAGTRRFRHPEFLSGIGSTSRRDELASGSEPLPGDPETIKEADEAEYGWRFGPISAGLLGIGVSQAWFRIAIGWVLYDDVSIWVVLIGFVVLAVGGPALARRTNPSPWGEGVTATELAWGGGVALGGILGLGQLLAAF